MGSRQRLNLLVRDFQHGPIERALAARGQVHQAFPPDEEHPKPGPIIRRRRYLADRTKSTSLTTLLLDGCGKEEGEEAAHRNDKALPWEVHMTRRKRHKSQPEKRPEIRLRLALHEDRPGDTAPSIADFANVCAALRTTLNYLCHDLTNKDVEFEVCDLVTGSAEMAVRPRPGIVSDEVARDLTFTYQATMESIEDDKPLDARLADRTIRAFAAYSSSIKKEGASLYFGSKRLSDHYIANIESLTEPIKPSLGSVSGKLEGLNVHGELRFTLYPAYQGEEIECRVDKSQQDRVLDLVGRKVTAHGTLHYVRSQVLPKSVDVEEFTEEPPDDQLPTLLDAKGTLSKSNRGGSRSGW